MGEVGISTHGVDYHTKFLGKSAKRSSGNDDVVIAMDNNYPKDDKNYTAHYSHVVGAEMGIGIGSGSCSHVIPTPQPLW